MNSRKFHDFTLYGGSGSQGVLYPLEEHHLSWASRGILDSDHGTGSDLSSDALGFLITVKTIPNGYGWLDRMHPNFQSAEDSAMSDVRRIRVVIVEQPHWHQGLGAQSTKMLVDLAFCGEHADVVHWSWCEIQHPAVPEGMDCGCLTREAFIAGRRTQVPLEEQQMLSLHDLQPSQLYISAGKLRLVQEWFDPENADAFDPIPVKLLGGRTVMMDGHTRAVAAHLAGWNHVPVYWDQDDLDLAAYAMYVRWCREEGITDPRVLAQRIVSHKEFEARWRRRCMEGR